MPLSPPSSPPPAVGTLLGFGSRGYRHARRLGLSHQDAADIRQEMIVEVLTRWPAPTKFAHAWHNAVWRVHRPMPLARFGTCPWRPEPVAHEVRMEVARLLRWLAPSVARTLLAWLDNPDDHEPQVRKRLRYQAMQALRQIRERLGDEAPCPHRKPSQKNTLACVMILR